MSQRSEIYRELRERIKTLGELAGQQSTNDLVKELDQFWRSLLRVRSAMIKTLVIQGQIEGSKDVSADDFASLFLRIHNPKRESRLCEHCCGLVEFGISTCPYCGEHVNGQNSQQFLGSISIDIKANPKGPNWNIDYSSKEILDKARLKEEFESTPKAVPRATRYEELGGPKGTTGEERVRTQKRKLSRTAAEILRWARRRELCSALPLAPTTVRDLNRYERLLLAQVFQKKSKYTDKEIFGMKDPEMIAFILGHQGDKPIDVGPPPIGEIPELGEESDDGN